MRHLDKFGPSEYLQAPVCATSWKASRGERGAERGRPANEPWQEQHWSERLPQSPEKGAPGRVGGAVGRQRAGDGRYNRKTGEASWSTRRSAGLLGTPGGVCKVRRVFLSPWALADSSSETPGRAPTGTPSPKAPPGSRGTAPRAVELETLALGILASLRLVFYYARDYNQVLYDIDRRAALYRRPIVPLSRISCETHRSACRDQLPAAKRPHLVFAAKR